MTGGSVCNCMLPIGQLDCVYNTSKPFRHEKNKKDLGFNNNEVREEHIIQVVTDCASAIFNGCHVVGE